ncbi:hypothetical protein ZWY2020_006385 [Hordeum vulgare]|nr:hypothetical protein ZWY2020_006385 [Hordeum vulgare]
MPSRPRPTDSRKRQARGPTSFIADTWAPPAWAPPVTDGWWASLLAVRSGAGDPLGRPARPLQQRSGRLQSPYLMAGKTSKELAIIPNHCAAVAHHSLPPRPRPPSRTRKKSGPFGFRTPGIRYLFCLLLTGATVLGLGMELQGAWGGQGRRRRLM